MGDPLDADSLKRVIFQLKRFLFLSAEHVKRELKLNKEIQADASGVKPSFIRARCPFVAPPLVDLAWRLFLTYTPFY